jgi:hypothetical protein
MLAPLPHPYAHTQAPNPYTTPQSYQPSPFTAPAPTDRPSSLAIAHDRWERMAVLFHSIRGHARGFEYPGPSVAALESVLIRLYLESPVGVSAPPLPGYPGMMLPNGSMGQVGDSQGVQDDVQVGANGAPMNGVSSGGMRVEDGS